MFINVEMSDRDGGKRRLRLKQKAAELSKVQKTTERRKKILELMQIRDCLNMGPHGRNMKWPCFIEFVNNAEEWASKHNTRIIQVAYFDNPAKHAGNTHIVFPMATHVFKKVYPEMVVEASSKSLAIVQTMIMDEKDPLFRVTDEKSVSHSLLLAMVRFKRCPVYPIEDMCCL